MERVCEELDEAKSEIDKLQEDLKRKGDLVENLKRAHNEQLIHIQETSSKIEQQAQELNVKEEEASVVKQRCEELRRSLSEKESIIRYLSSANDKLRVDGDAKNQKWEEQKRAMVLALDEAKEKNIDQEQKIHVFMAEIEGLKGSLSALQKKCLEAEKKARASRELKERDNMLVNLEEENRKVDDQLKWKKEQFKHLEEAHEKLQDQFKESKKEWELEKSRLINEICSLKNSLDSQMRISKDLQNRLNLCNQALAHEESRRKGLEIEISDFKTRFENVFTESQEAKSQLESLTMQRDKEIAALRHSLGTKETFYKEAEYRAAKLEQENQELLASLKELQEAQIQEAGNSSILAKLRNKLRSVEQMHRDCSVKLKSKEAEWISQLEILNVELNNCRSALEIKELAVKKLEIELDNCHSVVMQLNMQNEEASVMLLVLKSGIAEAQLKLLNAEAEMSLHDQKSSESFSRFMEQLEMKNAALAKALKDVEDECEKTASSLKRVELLGPIQEQQDLMQKELDKYKEILKESSRCHLRFKEQALLSENDLKEKIRSLCNALDMANSELDKERERTEILSRRVKYLDFIEEKQLVMQNEQERYKEMLEESSKCQACIEEHALQTESGLKEKLREVSDALHLANSELAEQCEKATSLSRRVESLAFIEEQQLLMKKELERYKEMIEESSRNQLLLEEKGLQMENNFKEKLRLVHEALDIANSELAEERDKVVSLLRRVESFDLVEEKQLAMQKDLEKYKEMLEESSRRQLQIEKLALQKENDFKEKLHEAHDALDRVNSELAEKHCEGHAVEFELWIWKSIAQHLKDDLEQSQVSRKELEDSLLAQTEIGQTIKQEKDELLRMLELKDSRLDNLQQQIELFEQEVKKRESDAAISARMDTLAFFESEKESFLGTMRQKDRILEDLQQEITQLEKDSLRRELEGVLFAQIWAERRSEHEKENLIELVGQKEQRINDLLPLVRSLEQKFISTLDSFSSELAEKQREIRLVYEAWEKISTAEILAQLEIEEKKLMIAEMEDDIQTVHLKLELQEISLSSAKQQAIEVEAELDAKQLEMEKLTNLMEMKLRSSEAMVSELKSEKRNLVEEVGKLSIERENLLGFIVEFNDRINHLSREDIQLMATLERMVQPFEDIGSGLVLKGGTELYGSVKENMNSCSSPTAAKRFQALLEERSPFRELN